MTIAINIYNVKIFDLAIFMTSRNFIDNYHDDFHDVYHDGRTSLFHTVLHQNVILNYVLTLMRALNLK